MCSVICRVRMEFISCRVLRENIPHKPSPWWVGEGRGRLQTSWKTGDRTKTKGAPGSGPSSRGLGGDRLAFAHFVRPFSPPSRQIHISPPLPSPPQCVRSQGGTWMPLPLQGSGWALCRGDGWQVGSGSQAGDQERGSEKRGEPGSLNSQSGSVNGLRIWVSVSSPGTWARYSSLFLEAEDWPV